MEVATKKNEYKFPGMSRGKEEGLPDCVNGTIKD